MTTYRTGRKLGRTIYRGDTLIGMMDTREDAERVVVAMNGLSEEEREALQWALDNFQGITEVDGNRTMAGLAFDAISRLLAKEFP